MFNDDFQALYAYNRWADGKILDACRTLTPEQYVAEPAPGWSSVRATVHHIAIVTNGWLRGLAGDELGEMPTEDQIPTVDEAQRLLTEADAALNRLLSALTPELLATPKTLSRRGRIITVPPWVILRHVANHSTYHRGQIAAKLKRLGVEPPGTDLIFWSLEQWPQS